MADDYSDQSSMFTGEAYGDDDAVSIASSKTFGRSDVADNDSLLQETRNLDAKISSPTDELPASDAASVGAEDVEPYQKGDSTGLDKEETPASARKSTTSEPRKAAAASTQKPRFKDYPTMSSSENVETSLVLQGDDEDEDAEKSGQDLDVELERFANEDWWEAYNVGKHAITEELLNRDDIQEKIIRGFFQTFGLIRHAVLDGYELRKFWRLRAVEFPDRLVTDMPCWQDFQSKCTPINKIPWADKVYAVLPSLDVVRRMKAERAKQSADIKIGANVDGQPNLPPSSQAARDVETTENAEAAPGTKTAPSTNRKVPQADVDPAPDLERLSNAQTVPNEDAAVVPGRTEYRVHDGYRGYIKLVLTPIERLPGIDTSSITAPLGPGLDSEWIDEWLSSAYGIPPPQSR
ncbi:hypothetical protein PRZ48_007408 [Zasmidium cellare]|uniref:Uncharacterized protein n=1 Tax=Zasmidium cellare TaxID=395010 RepID=A0ABR0EJP0_ZASCE|nr:hypothetical protein PRZ48_007408 [Zasmidium cellare]